MKQPWQQITDQNAKCKGAAMTAAPKLMTKMPNITRLALQSGSIPF